MKCQSLFSVKTKNIISVSLMNEHCLTSSLKKKKEKKKKKTKKKKEKKKKKKKNKQRQTVKKVFITKTCLYNFDPLKPHFLYSKTGVYKGILYFSFFCSKT